jgi:hypothetical protein
VARIERGTRRDLEHRAESKGMSSGGDVAAMSLNGPVGVTHPRSTGAAQAPSFVRRTAINLLGRVNELIDGAVCSVDAVTGPGIGP